MSKSISAPDALQALLSQKEAGEAAEDLDAILAAFSASPVFEFRPVGLQIAGAAAVRDFYSQMVANFVTKVAGFRAVETYWYDDGMAMEEEITVSNDDGSTTIHRFVVTTGVGEDGKLWGERLYGSEDFFRELLGDMFDKAEPLA